MKPKDVKNHGPKENFLDELIKTADKIMNRAEMGNRVSNLSPPEFSSFRDKILRGERAEPRFPQAGAPSTGSRTWWGMTPLRSSRKTSRRWKKSFRA